MEHEYKKYELDKVTKNELESIKLKMQDIRTEIMDLMEDYDTYDWQNPIKYFNADMTAVMALQYGALTELEGVIENHLGDLEEDKE